ncbi:hypothetical protein CCMA1212_000577 [Trichoderma ghanense]|uniref:Uncharacterized protein n=1 Tax=Trichoderma ghanense TaxID=65468 RepID=A0ABY2HJR7_9HYPO
MLVLITNAVRHLRLATLTTSALTALSIVSAYTSLRLWEEASEFRTIGATANTGSGKLAEADDVKWLEKDGYELEADWLRKPARWSEGFSRSTACSNSSEMSPPSSPPSAWRRACWFDVELLYDTFRLTIAMQYGRTYKAIENLPDKPVCQSGGIFPSA